MGFNTVAVLLNDFAGEIRKSGRFGEQLAYAMTAGWSMRDKSGLETWFGCGDVISQAHADYSQVVVVGKNTGRPIAECETLDPEAIGQIADALRRMGWTVKPPRVGKKASVVSLKQRRERG